MPTQTNFRITSGAALVDLSGVFEPLNGGVSYATATKYKVGSLDLTGIFYASTSTEDRIANDTGYKLSNGTDLKAVFRRYGFVGIVITDQPDDQIVTNSATATFTVAATENGNSFTGTYQWRKGGSNLSNGGGISGATTETLTITNAAISNDGVYDCVLTSGGSSVTSSSAQLRIKPYITAQPSNQNVNDLASASFSVTANGSGTLSYQWYKGNDAISGATSSTYSISSVNASSIANYKCKVTSNYDATGVESSAASLSIIAPVITDIDPNTGSYNYNNGDTVTFTVTATGTNLTYTFYRGATQVQTGSSNFYQFTVSSTNNGTYKCTVSNNGGFVNSDTVTIVRFYQNSITTQPVNATVVANGANDASFFVVAVGNTAPTYQWQRNISNTWTNLTNSGRVSGATSDTLVISDVIGDDNGYQYRCVVSNKKADGTDWSDTTSSTATLTVNYITITEVVIDEDGTQTAVAYNEQSFSVSTGDVVKLIITASANHNGNTTVNYQWKKWNGSVYVNISNGGNISGATTNTLTFNTIAQTDEQYYACFVTNAGGLAANTEGSREVFLSVYYQNSITDQPDNTSVNEGGTAYFNITAVGKSTPTYQWEVSTDGGSTYDDIIGATGSQLQLTNVGQGADQNKYRCVVSNLKDDGTTSWTNTTSSAATLTVNYINITDQPDGGTVNVGDTAAFSVTADGNPAISYQWQYSDGGAYSDISGATSNTYSFTVSSTSEAGNYRCKVYNAAITDYSDPAQLVVN